MKMTIQISKVEATTKPGWPTPHEELTVSGDGVEFSVPNTRQTRRTYVVGRFVEVTISPRATS